MSVWTVVLSNPEHFVNSKYSPTEDPLWPSLSPCKVKRFPNTRNARFGMLLHSRRVTGSYFHTFLSSVDSGFETARKACTDDDTAFSFRRLSMLAA